MFDEEEMIGTKIRALYQRNKGRDLFDLYELRKMNLNWDNIVACFNKLNIGASRLEFEKNLEDKMQKVEFLEDMKELLPQGTAYDVKEAYKWFRDEIISRM